LRFNLRMAADYCGAVARTVFALAARGGGNGLLSRLCRRCCLSLVGMQFLISCPAFPALCQHGTDRPGATRKPLLVAAISRATPGGQIHEQDKTATFDAHIEVEANLDPPGRGAAKRCIVKAALTSNRAELVAMRQAGASCADLVEWLRVSHRCRMHRSFD